ncbi:hypothetical protein [Ornithinicoccus hortensis]|uniref:SAF domain-containing protein n=1 Tax=Ornithinicoccus hortensis TaxID=82346 RepID=A0A542YQH4_9MICO|nr:hypothetical protein [Ornithinicoccus hortensis]TQL50350.1 hypothetical protein FB467_1455 [Ornithinicoccus hortensis]
MAAEEQARKARRLQVPGWRDARLLVGALLVLLSVAGGARLVAALDDTTPVYAAARVLLPGEQVAAEDLTAVPVRIGEPLEHYLDGSQAVQPGTYVLRQVAAGELVPRASLGTSREVDDKTVTVPVDPTAAGTLALGDVVDLWVSRRDPESPGATYLAPELLLEQAVVAGVPTGGRALGVGVGRAAVQVVVPADAVGSVIASVDQEARVTLVPAPRSAPTGD